MSSDDLCLLNQDIETIERRDRDLRSFECESIEPLLWACSLVNKLTPAGKFMLADFHPLLIGTPIEKLCQVAELRSEAQLALQRDVYMLWYWRSRISQKFDATKGNTIIDAISDIFTSREVDCAKKIKRISGDFIIRGKPFSHLSSPERYSLELCMRWRYHALEWVLNDESWYNTSTDT